ncbi:hypothetical protein DL765_006726 [Monosporascus sp. GIB2]|nr:hypothetical protein DL765_006726 [Monosporascus sp. GIB2]
MPPLRPRPGLLPRGTGSSSSTTSCLFAPPRAAFFGSTPAPRSQPQQIPPESPLFINVPNPPQDQSIEALRELKPVKGHLPVPRQVFKHRDAHLKPTAAVLAKAAPEPSSERSRREPGAEVQAWKRRMAASRRENLGSGLRELWQRKQMLDARRRERSERKLAENRAAATAPEREDDRLTRASVNAKTLATAVLPDPLRFERAKESRARTSEILARKSERRRDAIQELYMNARRFIIDEAALEAEVERAFDPVLMRGSSATGQEIRNIWDLEGPPDRIGEMLSKVSGASNHLITAFGTPKTQTDKRQKRIAEELTGGTMD